MPNKMKLLFAKSSRQYGVIVLLSLHVRVWNFPSAGSVTGSWPKHCVVSWELTEVCCGSAVCQCMQCALHWESCRNFPLSSGAGARSFWESSVWSVARRRVMAPVLVTGGSWHPAVKTTGGNSWKKERVLLLLVVLVQVGWDVRTRGRGPGGDCQDHKSRQQRAGGGTAIYFAGAFVKLKTSTHWNERSAFGLRMHMWIGPQWVLC